MEKNKEHAGRSSSTNGRSLPSTDLEKRTEICLSDNAVQLVADLFLKIDFI
jgi:hypothetical protein